MACFQAEFSILGKNQSPFSFADGSVPSLLLAALQSKILTKPRMK
jgi:hypothetical protein